MAVRERAERVQGRVLGLVVLLAVAVRARTAAHEALLFDDAPRFLASAQLFLDGEFGAALADAYHPLTSALMALAAWLFGVDLESAGVLLSVLSGGVAVAALYLLARDGFGEKVALVAALLFAVHPRTVAVASNVQSDGLHLAFFVSAALCAWRALMRGHVGYSLAAGVLCGLAYLTRPEGLAVAVVLALGLVVMRLRGSISWQHLARVAGGFAAPALLLGGPYLLSMYTTGGELVLTHKKDLLAGLSVPSVPRLVAALSEVLNDSVRGYEALWLYVLFALRWQRPKAITLYVLAYGLVFLGTLLVVHLGAGYISRRHWLPVIALLLPFAAMGLLTVARFVQERLPLAWTRRRGVVPVFVTSVIALFVLHGFTRPPEHHKIARKEAALWLSRYEVHNLATHRLRTAYYAGAGRYIPQPASEDPAQLLAALRREGADYLIGELEDLPALPEGGQPGLREVHRVPYEGGVVVVLRVEPPGVASPRPDANSARR